MSTQFSDLAEHTGTLIAVLGVFATLTGILIVAIWKIGTKLLFTFKTDVFRIIGAIDTKVEELINERVEYALKKEIEPRFAMIDERQIRLRETLPKEYLRLEGPGYKAIMDSLRRIEDHSEQVAEELRKRQNYVDHTKRGPQI